MHRLGFQSRGRRRLFVRLSEQAGTQPDILRPPWTPSPPTRNRPTAARPPTHRSVAGTRHRAPACPAPAGRTGGRRPAPPDASRASRRRDRLPLRAGHERRAHGRARQARHVPRRRAVHHVGVQVRNLRDVESPSAPRLATAQDRDRRYRVVAAARPGAGGAAAARERSGDRRAPPGRRAAWRSARQRLVFQSVTLDQVPIDVLAERLGASRGAIYKTLHDARAKLRRALTVSGYGERVS